MLFSVQSVYAEMVLMHMGTEAHHKKWNESCALVEHGRAVKERYYKFEGFSGSGGCHVRWDKAEFYEMFQFCYLAEENGNPYDWMSGHCTVDPSSGGNRVILSAMPGKTDIYKCSFICVTNGAYRPNFSK